MNISPANNNNSFKGNLIINNLKRNTSINLLTTKEMDKCILEKFQQTITGSNFAQNSPKKNIAILKDYVKSLAEITKMNIGNFKYPTTEDFAMFFCATKNRYQIDVPEFFSITHISK